VDILRPSKNIKTKITIATSVTSQTEMSVFDVTKFLSINKTFFFLLRSQCHSSKFNNTNNKWGKRMMNLTDWDSHILECVTDIKSVMVQS
jgi:hypothetical protein